MNNAPNNDSEQLTESKLSWVHKVHTLNPAVRPLHAHCAQVERTARAGRSVMAHLAPCRWAPYRNRVATQGCPPSTIQCLYPDSPTSQAARMRAVASLCAWVDRVVALADRVVALAGRVAGPCPSPTTSCRGMPLRALAHPCAPLRAYCVPLPAPARLLRTQACLPGHAC